MDIICMIHVTKCYSVSNHASFSQVVNLVKCVQPLVGLGLFKSGAKQELFSQSCYEH